jgi:serine/threonine-protein kinase 11
MISGGRAARIHSLTPEPVSGPARARRVRQVNGYLFRAKLGSGASSRVYLAVDTRTGTEHAVKRLRLQDLSRQSSGVAQLEREIRLMRLFNHPNILKLHEVLLNEAEREVFLVLEYARNGCLGAYVERGERLSIPCICSIVKQIVGAITHLHERGFVHEDIKPWNLLVDGGGRVLLADFGIGHSFQSAAMVVGSPAFQAPEALDDGAGEEEGEEDAGPQKEDVWALGVTLYQLLFMQLPFRGENLYEVVEYIRTHELEIPEGTDPRLAQLLRGMLTVDPARRWDVAQIIAHEMIRDATDRADDLPEAPPPETVAGGGVELRAVVCQPGFSFGAIVIPGQGRRTSDGAAFPRATPPVVDDSSDEEFSP